MDGWFCRLVSDDDFNWLYYLFDYQYKEAVRRGAIMGKLFDWVMDFLYDLASIVLLLLPESPFQTASMAASLDKFGDIMANVNYFIPFGSMVQIMVAYLTCVLIWYAVRWILRLTQYID